MIFSGRTYSVMLISSAQKFNDALSGLLPETDYVPVRTVLSIAAKRGGPRTAV